MSDVEPRDVADDVQEPAGDVVEPSDVQVVDEPASESVPAADEPSGAAISEAILGRAKDYGLSPADLEGFDGPRLERMFSTIDRRIMQPPAGQVQPQVPGAPAPVTPGMAPGVVPGDYTPLKIEFSDELDDSLVGPIKTVVEHLNGQLQEVHAFRRQAQEELRAMNVLREFNDFDGFLTKLGEDWAKDYGVGATVDMDPQSSEFQKRLEVFHGAKSLQADAQRRRQRMSVSTALTRSHHAVHWDRIAEMERTKLDGKIDRRRRGSAERPVKGKQPAMSPREEAIEAWR
ncbi:hypothetical protein LCGC14_0589710 [marine sediment metagenome]|uniref:Uncharacterized protein n=1 Tax=marine sediment metagenome TaxID=412755 RepID=A0A0F9RXQ1_9ZZZZ